MTYPDGNSKVWLQQLAAGEPEAVERFWNQYASPLERLAAGRMSPAIQRRVGADDVLQSVCRTFFRRSKAGEYELTESEELWRLLSAITINKVQQHARYHLRQRRNVQLEQADFNSPDGSVDSPINRVQSSEIPVEDAIAFVDQMQLFLDSLGDEERQLIQHRLDGLSHKEIAEKMKCSERTVRRIVQFVRNRWSKLLDEKEE